MSYIMLKDDEKFTDEYPTWIIAYCYDNDAFFVTNQRHFFWESEKEFESEQAAIDYFATDTREFIDIRNEIIRRVGGWNIGFEVYLMNTNKHYC